MSPQSGRSWYETATIRGSDIQIDWCPRCYHMDLQCGDILAMTSDGVQRIGGFAVCAECGWTPNAQRPRPAEPTTP